VQKKKEKEREIQGKECFFLLSNIRKVQTFGGMYHQTKENI
jgi:hypothetical protein